MSATPTPAVDATIEDAPPPLRDFDEPVAGGLRTALIWLLAVALAGAITLWLALLSVSQATSEAVALPLHERGLAALTEIDALLDAQLEAVQAQADGGAQRLSLPGYPVRDAEIETSTVVVSGSVDRALLRAALLERSARLVYERGSGALGALAVVQPDAPLTSRAGFIRTMQDWPVAARHSDVTVPLWLFGAASIALAAALFYSARGFGRLIAPALALVAGALPVLAGAFALRLLLSMFEGGAGEPLLNEYVALARELTALPLRNALWLAAAGLALALPALLAQTMFDQSVRRGA